MTEVETLDLFIAYHKALDNLLALTHREVDGLSAKTEALSVLGVGYRELGLAVTVSFADDAIASQPPSPSACAPFPSGFFGDRLHHPRCEREAGAPCSCVSL